MEKLSKISLAFSGTLLCLFLVGCTGETSGPFGDTPEVHEGAVGTTECFSCHADGAIAGLSNVVGDSDATRATGWLWGPHGNSETLVDPVNHVINDISPFNEGFPYFGYGGLGQNPSCTTECHDPLGDGELLDDFFAETSVDTLGRLARPVVGCESCHGSGESHFGIGPIANAVPGPEKCGECHNSTFDHNAYHPEGDNIYEDYRASLHNTSINSHNYIVNSTTDVTGLCSKCHTEEGAKLYKAVTGGHDALAAALANAPAVQSATQVQCRTCHDAHNPLKLLIEETGVLGNTVTSAEYNTCTSCHQTGDSYHGENSGYSWGPQGYPPSVGIGNFDSAEIIYDTHIDNSVTTWIEGYVLDTASDRSCRDCHNPHSADTAINKQWAKSAHGGFILEKKELAFANTGSAADPYAEALAILSGTFEYGSVTEADGPAWVHYDFKASNRTACARCHTATGFRNLASDPVNYDPANNVFTATGEQREMLYCWACHSSNAGDLRDAYLFKNTSSYTAPAGRIADVPDLNGSNVCMACHSGRASGAQITASTADFTNTTFMNSHYLAAGGTVFRTTGYEYYSASAYDNAFFYMHDDIGVSIAETGDNGPCAGCHMGNEEGHTFEAVTHDGTGAISGINSYDDTCSVCHGTTASDKAALINILDTREAGYHAALDVLEAELAAKGFVFLGGHPYFSNTDWTSLADPTGKRNMGAAFNFNLLYHEPGAYVHNSLYTRRLIFDSIDWMDNGTLNATIGITNAAALGYLGSTRP